MESADSVSLVLLGIGCRLTVVRQNGVAKIFEKDRHTDAWRAKSLTLVAAEDRSDFQSLL